MSPGCRGWVVILIYIFFHVIRYRSFVFFRLCYLAARPWVMPVCSGIHFCCGLFALCLFLICLWFFFRIESLYRHFLLFFSSISSKWFYFFSLIIFLCCFLSLFCLVLFWITERVIISSLFRCCCFSFFFLSFSSKLLYF